MSRRSSLSLPAAVALLAGCTAQGSFPSLAPRAVERQYGAFPPATGPCAAAQTPGCDVSAVPAPTVLPVDDPALRPRVAELAAAAAQGDEDFARRLPAAAERIAHAGPAGSDAWVGAQQELSRLESARAKTLDAVAGLDALALERAKVATSAADLDAITAAAAEARELTDRQQAELDRLHAALDPQ